jgi:hypothetical protein
MTPILLPVATEDVRHVWPQIRDRVAKLVGDLGEPCLPEDVYFELARGGTYLWTTDDVRGFIVVQVLVNPYSRTLHVWMASSEKGDWSPAVFDQIKAIATDNKCGSRHPCHDALHVRSGGFRWARVAAPRRRKAARSRCSFRSG